MEHLLGTVIVMMISGNIQNTPYHILQTMLFPLKEMAASHLILWLQEQFLYKITLTIFYVHYYFTVIKLKNDIKSVKRHGKIE